MRARIAAFSKVPFVRDVATMQIGRLVTVGCGLLTSILYIRYLGLAGYGEYAVILAFVGTFGIVTNLGQQATLMVFLAESYGKKDRDAMIHISRYYTTASALVVLLLTTFAVLAPMITTWIYTDPRIGALARLVLVSSIFEVAFSYYAISLQVVREIKLLTFLENAKTVLQVALAILLLILGYGVVGVLVSSLVTSMCYCILTCFLYPRLSKKFDLPHFGEILRMPRAKYIWKYGRDGMWIAVDKNIGNLYPHIFLFALSTQTPKQIVGLLRLAFKLADLPASFALNSVSRLANSVLSTIAGQGGGRLQSSFLRLTRHTLLMHTSITLAGMLLIPPLLPLVYGQDFRVAAYPFLIITALQLVYGIHTSATPVLRIHSKVYIATAFNIVAMTTALLVFFILKDIVSPTRALYVGLLLYHSLVTCIIIPTWKLLPTTND